MYGVATDSQHPNGPEALCEYVFLIHGLGRTRHSLRRLRDYIEKRGYRAFCWRYPSRTRSIKENGEDLIRELSKLDRDPAIARIHIAAHSLGGILVRYALSQTLPEKMGRVVMLAPPNCGSRLAKSLARLFGWLVKPLRELSNAPSSVVNQLPAPVGIDIGVIAAERDFKVRVEDTHLSGEKDHLVVPGSHTFIMNRREVLEAIGLFLRTGQFRA